jgi:hypothetical protein
VATAGDTAPANDQRNLVAIELRSDDWRGGRRPARVSAGYLLSTPSGLGAANSTRTTFWPLARRTARMRALAK